MAVLNLSDAAKAIGYQSRSTLYRLLNEGTIDEFVRHQGGRRMLEVDGLAAAVSRRTQPRMTSLPATQGREATDWKHVARVCNSYLAPEHWGPPPWSERQWLTLWVSLQDALAGWPEAIETEDMDCDERFAHTSTGWNDSNSTEQHVTAVA